MHPLTGIADHNLGFADSEAHGAFSLLLCLLYFLHLAVGSRRAIRLELDLSGGGTFSYQDIHHSLVLTFKKYTCSC